jgi:hypothetical protein
MRQCSTHLLDYVTLYLGGQSREAGGAGPGAQDASLHVRGTSRDRPEQAHPRLAYAPAGCYTGEGKQPRVSTAAPEVGVRGSL